MGWLFSESWPTASAMRDHLRKELRHSGYEIVKDALTSYGRHYYAAVKFLGRPETDPSCAGLGKTGIFVALLDRDPSSGWGYKDMSETMGPCEVDCPLSVLDAADPIDVVYSDWPDTPEGGRAWARGWREKVRAYHAEKAASRATAKALKPGDRVWLKRTKDNPFTIASVDGRKLRGYGASGVLYRLPRTKIERVEAA